MASSASVGRRAPGLEGVVADLALQDLLDLAPDGDAAVAGDLHATPAASGCAAACRPLSQKDQKSPFDRLTAVF